MAGQNWTDAQKSVIDSRGENLLVSAAAGSGKTTVMIERIVSLIKEGVSLADMAVCTFTNASAADMRDKLTRRLGELAGAFPSMCTQLRILPQADISTLHKWCNKIIKTYFYASDMDAAYEILDDSEAAALLDESIERALEEEITAQDEYFLKLYDIMLSGRKHKKLKKIVKKLYDYSMVQPNPSDWLSSCYGISDESAREEIQSAIDKKCGEILQKAKILLSDICSAGFVTDFEMAENLVATLIGGGALIETVRFNAKRDLQFKNLHESLLSLRKQYNEKVLARSYEVSLLPSAQDTFGYLNVLIRIVRRVREIYAQSKSVHSYADYSDLEHETLKILNSGMADGIFEKYKYVFVDEYQDINPLQEAILTRFNGTMFFVGDVKQSIYGFRMCAPEFFVGKRSKFLSGEGGRVIELNANFRSDNQILQFVNKIFSRCMTPEFGKVDYSGDACFEQGRNLFDNAVISKFVKIPKEEKQLPEPKIYSVLAHDYTAENEGLECETDLVLGHILELLSKNITDNGVNRPVAFSDIAILVRGRDKFSETLMRKLTRAEIPVSINAAEDIFSHRSIVCLISYLKLIDNLYDDVSMAAVMLSCFGNFSDDDLAKLRINFPAEYFYESVLQAAQSNAKVKEFIALVQKFAVFAKAVKVDELAGYITAETEYFKLVLSIWGEAEAAALSEFLDSLKDNNFALSLYEYISRLNAAKQELSPAAETHAVRIMTIHSSKGLEFPFVLLPNINKKFNVRDLSEPMLLGRGVSLKYFDWNSRTAVETLQYTCEKLRLKKTLLEEEMRILYVALTRAKYQIAIFGQIKNEGEIGETVLPEDANCYFDWIYPAIAAPEIFSREESRLQVDATVKKSIIFAKPNEELATKIKQRIDFVYPQSRKIVKSNVTKLISDANLEEKIEYVGGGGDDDRALKTGTAYHKIMEKIDFYLPFQDEWARLSRDYSAEISLVDKDKICAAAAKMADFTKGAVIFKEQQFVLLKNVSQTDTLIQGVIDLIVLRGGRAEIVDYKTTRGQNLLSAQYAFQLAYYAEAVESILKIKVDNKYIYSFKTNELIEM